MVKRVHLDLFLVPLNLGRNRRVSQHVFSVRSFHARIPLRKPVTFVKPSEKSVDSGHYPSVSTCPEPTCGCTATPQLPKEVDRTANIKESAPGYVQHVVICTGKSDWSSRIEDEGKLDGETLLPPPMTPKERFKSTMKSILGQGSRQTPATEAEARPVGLARGLKANLGRNGPYFDPMRPMLVTNASFPQPPSGEPLANKAAAYLFPAFKYVSEIADTPTGHAAFIQTFLGGENTKSDTRSSSKFRTAEVTIPTILICSHGTRDSRCGVLGPVLSTEFQRQLTRLGVSCNGVSSSVALDDIPRAELSWHEAHVAMVSHIGGHKWAGNVIVYMPSGKSNAGSPLAGKGVWYGRVEPRHVEGIVTETILRGRIIEELCRGVRG